MNKHGIAGLVLGMIFWGCGYSLQTSKSHLVEKEEIRRVYVAPLRNDTYKAGVENVVYNALVKTISSHRQLIIVQNKEDADAILQGSVDSASYGQAAPKAVTVGSASTGTLDTIVATEYSAALVCSFTLLRRVPRPKMRSTIWTGGFSRTKPFPANNQLGVLGTTSQLINDSEFDRALKDLADSMMADVHESMLSDY